MTCQNSVIIYLPQKNQYNNPKAVLLFFLRGEKGKKRGAWQTAFPNGTLSNKVTFYSVAGCFFM